MSNLARTDSPSELVAVERVLVQGDLSKLNPEQRVIYYNRLCESLGLNPLTRPFEYLNLQGKTVLYARRDCTDQLRKIHSISIKVVGRETVDGMLIVTTQAATAAGRTDESIGAVSVDGLKGEALANALMKADTKAKRRVTLSICGLGMLDESELDGARHGESQAHSPHDDGGDYSQADGSVFSGLNDRMTRALSLSETCDSYQKALEIRELIGTAQQQSRLTKDIQAAKETRMITPDQHKELSKAWQKINRDLDKPKGLFAMYPPPDVTATFVDEPDPAEDFDRSL